MLEKTVNDTGLDSETTYAITLSPPFVANRPDWLWQEYRPIIDELIRPLCKSYIMYTEFSNEGRMHFHGVLHGYDKIKYYRTKYKIHRAIGFSCIKPLISFKDKLQWMLYCQKGYRLTTQVLENLDGSTVMLKIQKERKRKKTTIIKMGKYNAFEKWQQDG